MFRRLFRPNRATAALDDDQLSGLAAANQLMENGKPGEAAPLLAGIAANLERPRPRRAANIHARAAHAYADAGQEQPALAQARSALRMFIQYNMAERTPVFYTNIRRKFTHKNMPAAAASLQTEFHIQDLPPQAPDPAGAPAQARQRGHLPGNCPKCGAPLRPGEVDWVDDRSAECSYCGSLVSAVV